MVKVPAGKTVAYTVSEERDFGSQVAFTNSDDQAIRIVIDDKVTSDKVKAALKEALGLKWKLAETQREIAQQERQLKVVTDDQQRLRANLREMPPTAEAYKRYLKKFDDQETVIEQFQAKIKQLQDGEHAQKKSYETSLPTSTPTDRPSPLSPAGGGSKRPARHPSRVAGRFFVCGELWGLRRQDTPPPCAASRRGRPNSAA